MRIVLKLLVVLLAARLLLSVYRSVTRGSTRSSERPHRPEKRVQADDIVDAEFEDQPAHRPGDAKR